MYFRHTFRFVFIHWGTNKKEATWTHILVLQLCKVYNACVKPYDLPDPPRLNLITTVAAE
jgi:hypothetical protein